MIFHYCYDGIENTAERFVQPLENDLEQAVAKHAWKKEGYRLVYQDVNSTAPGVVDITYYYESCKPTEPKPQPQPQPKPKPHKATKRWWIALALLLVIAGCIAFFVPHLQTQDAEPQYAVGDYVTFGTYPQTAEGNDETPIEWLVLDRDGDNVLLLSRYGLDVQPYSKEYGDIAWEKCTLRTWLNSDFMNRAFTASERSAILLTNVDNSSSQCYSGYDTSGGNNTQDKVFLLSYAEANKYLGVTYDDSSNMKSRVAPTAYAIAQGAYASDSNKTADGQAAGWWWLRSPGYIQSSAADVNPDGSLYNFLGYNVWGSVRPALWVNLKSGIF